MIDVIFQYGSEIVMVRVINENVLFSTSQYASAFVPIDGIRLNHVGVVREFPDLKDKADWRNQAIIRFKEKLKSMKTETEKMNYVILELTKYGYQAIWWKQEGHRQKRL